tara:strand:- start:337 stop:612 length:276 start_codon:yes stop_codon:yes gene_type:complete
MNGHSEKMRTFMENKTQSNEKLFYSDLKTRLQRDRREERLYIRLTKNEKERLRQFAGKVGMPLGEFVLNIGLAYSEQYERMAEEGIGHCNN